MFDFLSSSFFLAPGCLSLRCELELLRLPQQGSLSLKQTYEFREPGLPLLISRGTFNFRPYNICASAATMPKIDKNSIYFVVSKIEGSANNQEKT